MSDLLDKAIAVTLTLVVVFAALAHGVVEPWSVFIFELITAGLMLMWTVKAVADKKLILVIPQTVWPLAVLVLFGLAQSLSWKDGAGVRQSLSFDVDTTRGTVMVLCSLLILAVMAASFLTSAGRLLVLTRFLIFFGAVMGVFGLAQYFSGTRNVYWLRQTQASMFGPFYNRDHFAGYMELFIALPVALIVTGYVRGEKRMIYGIAAMFMGVAAIFTLSRGGMISILAEMMFLAAMSFRHHQTTSIHARHGHNGHGRARMVISLVTVGVILAAVVTGVIWIGAEPVINRIATGNPNGSELSKAQPLYMAQTLYNARGEIWENTWTMICHNPLTGVGLGAYETAYPIYARESGIQGITAEAHNDYLQILADAGIIGAILALWFIVTLFRAVARGVRSPDPLLAAIALGGGAGLFGLLIHSFFDFNLHLPSHGVVFLFLSVVVSHIGTTVDEPVKAEPRSTSISSNLIREVSS